MQVKMSTILGATGKTLITLGVLILLFAAFQLWGTGIAESRAQGNLETEFTQRLAEVQANPEPVSDFADNPLSGVRGLSEDEIPQEGDAVGTIEIPSIGVFKTFVEGIDRDVLRSGPGHYPSTPLPGQPGNSGIAGHRTTYGAPFLDIDKVKPGDIIKVTTLQGEFFYEIESHNDTGEELGYFIVDPSRTDVLAQKDYNSLTLTACHPKYSARQRIIVTARLTSEPAPRTALPIAESDPAAYQEELVSEFTDSLGWQPEQTQPTLIWAIITLAVATMAWLVGREWKRWPTYALAFPLVATCLFLCFTHLEKLIPAV